MGTDAVVLLRPRDASRVPVHVAYRDPGTLLVPLDDGALLFHSFVRYAHFEKNRAEVRQWLESVFGTDLPAVHDDPRGVLVLPDTREPRKRTYDEAVAEMEPGGFWVPLDDSEEARAAAARHDERTAAAAKAYETKMQQLMALLGEGKLAGPEAMAAFAALAGVAPRAKDDGEDEGTGPFDVAARVVLVQRRTPLSVNRSTVNDVVVLPDGSTAIYGTDAGDLDSLSWRLADQHGAWVDEHGDPRGVPSFPPGELDLVRRASSYDAALASLGEKVVFVHPKGIDARDEERLAKLARLFGDG